MINAAAFKDCMLCAYAALQANVQPINDLNVFPVPDGDTGTNMGLTMERAAQELRLTRSRPRRTAWPPPCCGPRAANRASF